MGSDRRERRNRFAVRFVETYRQSVGPRISAGCALHPTCSSYALDAYRMKGFVRATASVVVRLARCWRAGRRASRVRWLRVLTVVAVALTFVVLLTLPAGAGFYEGEDVCHASIGGQSVDTQLPDNPVVVPQHASVPVSGQVLLSKAGDESGEYGIGLQFAGIQFATKQGTLTKDGKWSDIVAIDKYAKYGVGRYVVRMFVNSGGTGTCKGYAFIKVEGNPLGTAAGDVAVALDAVALVGLVTSGASAAKPPATPPGFEEVPGSDIEIQDKMDPAGAEARRLQREKDLAARKQEGWEEDVYQSIKRQVCAVMVLPALVLTLGAMASDGGVARGKPRFVWRPRISVIGSICGLLGGIGTFVLLQQYSVIYPTRTAAIVALALGVLIEGILVPSLLSLRGTAKANRRIAGKG